MTRAPSYDRIAPFYDILSRLVFGNQLLAAQTHFLPQLVDPRRVLILGGGTGKLLIPLLQSFPKVQVDFVESSQAMISIAKTKIALENSHVNFIHGTEGYLLDKIEQYDLIATPFVLDVFESKPLEQIFQLLYSALTPGGIWTQTDFYVDRNSPWWQKSMIWLMYRFFKIVSGQQNQKLPDFDRYFESYPLRLLAQKTFYHAMVRTLMYQKL